MSTNKNAGRREPNPDRIVIPDPGKNVIVYKGECYSRTSVTAPIDTIPGYPHEGWTECLDCLAAYPTPTPTPTYTWPAPAVVGFPIDISSHMEGDVVDVEVHRLSGFNIPFDVDYEVIPLSASYPEDYTVPNGPAGTLEFKASDTVKYIRIILNHDGVDSPALDELIHINLHNARATAPRYLAEVDASSDLRIIQFRESNLPPYTDIHPNDVKAVTESTPDMNFRFSGDPGEDATIQLYPDIINFPSVFYPITVKNDAGNFVWDDDDFVGTRYVFTYYPETHNFTVPHPSGTGTVAFSVTYSGPIMKNAPVNLNSNSTFDYDNESHFPVPTPTPTPVPNQTS